MWNVITILRVLVMCGTLPCICGIFPARRWMNTEQNRISVAGKVLRFYVCGWFAMWTLFELTALPFIAFLGRYTTLFVVYTGVILVWIVVSLLLELRYNRREMLAAGHTPLRAARNVVSKQPKAERIFEIVGYAVIAVLVLWQVIFFMYNQHLDGDDSYYVAQSVVTKHYNTMFQREVYTGYPILKNGTPALDTRHALSALPVFLTWMSDLCGMAPAAFIHSFFAGAMLVLMYGIFALLGKELLREHKAYVPVFLFFVNLWYVFGNVSIYTPETFAYTRTWQGKALFGNIMIPVTLLLLWKLCTQEGKRIYEFFLFAVMIAATMTTTATIFMLPLMVGIVGIGKAILEKRVRFLWSYIWPMSACLVMAAVYAYIKIRF